MRPAAASDWRGAYFDGRTAERHAVTVTLGAVAIRITDADGRALTWPYGEVRQVQGGGPGEPARFERGGDVPEVLVVDDPDFLRALRAAAPHYRDRFTDAPRRRSRARLAFAGIVAALAAALAVYAWGIPLLAGRVASLLPVAWEESLGRRVIEETVDPAAVCPAPAPLTLLVDRLAAAQPSRYRFQVTVVNDPAVNAFALPGGYLVVNRGLIELAASPEELAGVLAHEIQHVRLRHGTRAVLREVPLRLIVAAVTADAGVAGQVANAAATLGSLRYSRAAEEEADREGMRLLQAAGVDPRGMVTFFGRLEEHHGDVPRMATYFSTHPRTEARIRQLERMLPEPRGAPLPVMDAGAWAAVRGACAALPG
jgi:beta-barrel assembly-enhancing protease